MVSEKKRKQQLKAPDEFQKKAFKFADWCAANQVQIVIALVAVLLLVAVNISWKIYQSKQGEGRREELALIDEVFNKELEEAGKKSQALQTEMAGIDRKLKELDKAKADTPESAELAEKKAALQKQISEIKPKHDETAKKYRAYYEANKDNPEGLRAGLAALNAMVQGEKFKESTELAEDILAHADSDLAFYHFQVRLMYLSLLEEQGLYSEALAEVDTLMSHAGDEEVPKVLLAKARLEILAEKKTEAVATLDKLINEHNSSPEAQKAKAMKYIW
ncbi:MAG: hypothetical protein HRU09_03145 [Oligoflexales bacterium]|nr:hypothetical protein [Oligoflexales bacterium]